MATTVAQGHVDHRRGVVALQRWGDVSGNTNDRQPVELSIVPGHRNRLADRRPVRPQLLFDRPADNRHRLGPTDVGGVKIASTHQRNSEGPEVAGRHLHRRRERSARRTAGHAVTRQVFGRRLGAAVARWQIAGNRRHPYAGQGSQSLFQQTVEPAGPLGLTFACDRRWRRPGTPDPAFEAHANDLHVVNLVADVGCLERGERPYVRRAP